MVEGSALSVKCPVTFPAICPLLPNYSGANKAIIAEAGVNFAPPGGESMHGVGVRMREWTVDIATQHAGDEVLAFTHGVAIRCLIGLEENWPEERSWQTQTGNTSVTSASVTDITLDFQNRNANDLAT